MHLRANRESLLNPFWSHPRATITPHIAAVALPEVEMDPVVANIQAIEAGRAPIGLVDIVRGY